MTRPLGVRLRRIRLRSVFLLFFVLYALVGLLVGGGLVLAARYHVAPEAQLTFIDRLGLWLLVVLPALYGFLGGSVAAVLAVLYNVAAAVTGGIRLELRPGGSLLPSEGREFADRAAAEDAPARGEPPAPESEAADREEERTGGAPEGGGGSAPADPSS